MCYFSRWRGWWDDRDVEGKNVFLRITFYIVLTFRNMLTLSLMKINRITTFLRLSYSNGNTFQQHLLVRWQHLSITHFLYLWGQFRALQYSPEISKSVTNISCGFFHSQGLRSGNSGVKLGVSFLTIYLLLQVWLPIG